MHFRHLPLALGLCAMSMAAHADHNNFSNITLMTQQNFRLLSEDLGAAFSYKPVIPVEPLGITGFDLGVEVTATKLANPEMYRQATGSSNSTLYIPKLHAHKGLPLGFDIGVSYSEVPGGDIRLIGAEARYALIEGGIATPAVGVRVNYSTLKGSDRLDLNTRGIDLSISKGFAMFTPYAGIGTVWVDSDPHNAPGLRREKFSQNKYFVGANVNLLMVNIAVEADRTGDTTSYTAKAGWRW